MGNPKLHLVVSNAKNRECCKPIIRTPEGGGESVTVDIEVPGALGVVTSRKYCIACRVGALILMIASATLVIGLIYKAVGP